MLWPMGDRQAPLYYHDYLQLDRLLSSQVLQSDTTGEQAHDDRPARAGVARGACVDAVRHCFL